MNRFIKLTILLLAMLLPATALAHDFEVNGIYYNKSGSNAIVTYRGSSYNDYSDRYVGNVSIPSTVTYNGTTYSVTSISDYAFYKCYGLTNVNIPNSVTSIGWDAFYYCTGLTNVNIPNSVTTIGWYAFYYCTGLTNVNIPNSVTSIGSDAFSKCSGLTNVTIPNSVTTIGSYAFYGCSGLTRVNISDLASWCRISFGDAQANPLYYAHHLFLNGQEIQSLAIPNTITSIGSHAFYGCESLTSLTIPSSVTSIGEYAFRNCSNLANVNIPNSVTSIGMYAFAYSKLTDVYCYNDNPSTVIMGPYVFTASSYSNRKLHVPSGSLAAFQSSSNWQPYFSNIVEMTTNVLATSITLNKTSAELTVGETMQLTATVLPSNATNKTVTWTTSNSSVATVNSSGFVTAKSAGSATITGKTSDGTNLTASCVVTVRQGNVLATSISLDKSSANLKQGETMQLIATILPYTTTNKNVTWTSSNSTIASVNNNGLVTAKSIGTATITAKTTDGSNLQATCTVTVYAFDQNLQTGEWAVLDDGSPAKIGQTTNDHVFVRNIYDDTGEMKTYDNVVTFKSGTPQIVWLWLDDDEIYLNEKVQALPKTLTKDGGDPYNEITYNSFQCNIYLPESVKIVKSVNEDGDEISFVQGDRMPNSAQFKFAVGSETKVIDGITYQPYTLIISNQENNGTHFSAKNATRYKNNGALKKDDAPLLGIFLQNDNQDEIEGRLPDMIIANQEFGLREPFIVEPKWEPNDYRFIYGEGGNNETQRFQYYNRVALYGSSGIENSTIYVDGVYLNTTYKSMDVNETFQLTATVTPSYATNKTLTWKSSNTSVATVDNNGNVRAISPGNATITATSTDGSNKSASCYVTVTNSDVLATSISLNTNSLSLGINESAQLVATIQPSNATNKSVNWYSSNTNVATVNSNGLVTAVAEGEAIIFVTTTDGSNLFASCPVTVSVKATSISLSSNFLTLDVNQTTQLTATISPSNATNKEVTWQSSNPSVATVSSDGVVTTLSTGTTMITATTTDGSDLSATCQVVVVRLASSISLNETSLSLNVNQTAQLTATVYPSNASNKNVTWKSSNTAVATVSSSGLVTAKSSGTATITATTTDGTNLSASCAVTVSVQATSISLNSNSLTLDVDQSTQLTATISPSNATNKEVIWQSSNASVAIVSSNGVVTAISPGTAVITASTTDGSNLTASCQVVVVRLVRSISLNETSLSLNVNQTAQLTATVYPSNASNKNVTWKSSNTSVATVSSSGLVTAKASGSATITATTTDGSNLSASCVVTVSTVPVSSISLNKSYLTLDISDTYQLIATVSPSNATNKTVTWMSNNPAIVTVSSNGLVTPVAPGNATIIAKTTDGTNLTASCQVTVVKRVTSIALNENSLTLTLPETAQLIATITPSDATNSVLNWTSSKPSVATVDNNGKVTSVGVGTATIKATTTDGTNLSASCQVTVNKQYITSVTLNESSLVLHAGDTYQLIADVQPENASNKTLTWSTGNSSVATVDNNGLVTAVAEGTTYIKAATTDGSYLNVSCTIEVLSDYYLTLDTLSHVRGSAVQVMDLPVTLVNRNLISGIQFDVTLPSGIEFNLVDGFPDVWLDDARSTRTHSISANQLSNGNYRVLVTSSSSKDLKGNDGVLVHMNMLLPQRHDSGNCYINISNIIASEADETRHTLSNTSAEVHFYYIVGDADANASVDIADHAATASKILGKSPSPFYNDAADVDANSSLDVVDLVGITNIALEIKPITIRQAPRRSSVENRLFCDKLNLNIEGEKEITIGMDCDFDFAGFQMDVTLPHGLELVDVSIGEKAAKLGLATDMMPDGKIRILGTSFSDAVVDGVCQELLKLKVRANRGYINGTKIEFSDILFAERDMTAHNLDDLSIEYVEPSAVYELMEDAKIYVENGNIIVDTPYAGTVQLIAPDGRMVEYQAFIGHNVYPVDVTGIFIIHFVNKTVKVLL